METRSDPRFATLSSSKRVGREGWARGDFVLATFSGTDSFVQNTLFFLSEFLSATVLFVSFPHQSAHYFLRLPSGETKKPVQIEKFLQVTSKRRDRERQREIISF